MSDTLPVVTVTDPVGNDERECSYQRGNGFAVMKLTATGCPPNGSYALVAVSPGMTAHAEKQIYCGMYQGILQDGFDDPWLVCDVAECESDSNAPVDHLGNTFLACPNCEYPLGGEKGCKGVTVVTET